MDHSSQVKADPRRAVPAVDRVVEALDAAHPELPAWAVRAGVRRALAEARERLAAGGVAPEVVAQIEERARAHAADLAGPHPARVVNATGVVLHTNLGRAPLAPGAAEAAAQAAQHYSDLEFDRERGRRGDRLGRLGEKLVLLSGAEAAFAVNNNAAALLLALTALARGREVVISRGELVEIGGSFRVPDILERSGARMVEVGTTNRTHFDDYRRAIGPETAVLLKVHRSNFEQRGFVAEVDLAELAALGRERGIPVVEDLGSGTLVDFSAAGLPEHGYAPSRLRRGADLVCFSGDKLLGGPQAGIILGRRDIVESMRRDPLARALRLDKLSLAALDWTATALLEGRAEREIPVLRQLLEPAPQLERRARALADRLEKVARAAGATQTTVAVLPERAPVGGGSLPGFALDGWVVALRSSLGADALAQRLRRASVPVIGRVREDALLLDVRTLLDADMEWVETAVAQALANVSR